MLGAALLTFLTTQMGMVLHSGKLFLALQLHTIADLAEAQCMLPWQLEFVAAAAGPTVLGGNLLTQNLY